MTKTWKVTDNDFGHGCIFKIQLVFWQASFLDSTLQHDKGWKPNVNIRALTDNCNIISSFPDRYISLTNFTPLLFSHDQAVK